jgi:hypothetical protein
MARDVRPRDGSGTGMTTPPVPGADVSPASEDSYVVPIDPMEGLGCDSCE